MHSSKPGKYDLNSDYFYFRDEVFALETNAHVNSEELV